MMIDTLTEFSNKQSVSGAASSGVIVGETYDTTSGDNSITGYGKTNDARDLGTCTDLYLNLVFDGSYTNAATTTSNLELQLVTSDNADGSDATAIATTGVLTKVQTSRGQVYSLPLPTRNDYKRYLGVRAVRTGTVAAGTSITSHLYVMPNAPTQYGDAKTAGDFRQFAAGDTDPRPDAPNFASRG